MNTFRSACMILIAGLFSLSSADIISGIVTDSIDNEPINLARISTDATHYTFSKADGTFSLNTDGTGAKPIDRQPAPRQILWNPSARCFSWTGYDGTVVITLCNTLGKQVVARTLSAQNASYHVDFSLLPYGMYVAIVKTGNDRSVFKVLHLQDAGSTGTSRNAATLDRSGTSTQHAAAAVNNLLSEKNGYVSLARTFNGSQSNVSIKMFRDSVLTIRNDSVEAKFTRSTELITARSFTPAQQFIKKGDLSQKGGSAKIVEITDSAFGAGQAIEVRFPNGNRDRIIIFPKLPFVCFKKTWKNQGAKDTIIKNIQPVSMTLGMPVAASALKANGTAGLTAVNGHPGSYTYLSIANPATRNGAVAGWITQTRGGGVVFSTISGTDAAITGQIDYGKLRIKPGLTADMELFAVGYFNIAQSGLEKYADAIARAYSIVMRPCPTVYCTWYDPYNSRAGSEAGTLQRAQWLETNLVPFGFSVVQIDDGWQKSTRNFSDYDHSGAYPGGMKKTADSIKSNNFTAGLWFMPFAGDGSINSSWYLKDDAGAMFEKTDWAGITLDPTIPEVKSYIKTITNMISNTWGYKYFKIDGMYTGMGAGQCYVNDAYNAACWRGDTAFNKAKFYDSTLTNFDVYRQAFKLIRETAGNVFIMGCAITQSMYTLGGSFGLMDALRVGPDNSPDWKGVSSGLLLGGQRYFFGCRVFYIDPDPVYLRVPILEAKTTCSYVAITGFMNSTSEDYAGIAAENINVFKRVIPHHGLNTARPADYYDRSFPSIWLLTDTTKNVRRDVIGLFNFNETAAMTETCPMSKIGLSATQQYVGFDFWANTFVAPWSGNLSIVLAAKACRVLAARPVSENPILISTSRHVAHGIVDVLEEKWDAATKTLRGTSKVVARDPYELRIIAMKTGGTWSAATAMVSAADQTAGVTIAAPAQSGTGVRVMINSGTSREVKWSVTFN